MLKALKNLFAILALAVTITACNEELTSPIPTDANQISAQVYIVELKAPVENTIENVAGNPAVNKFLNDYNISTDAVKFIYTSVLNGFAAELSPALVNKIKADPRVAIVEADQIKYAFVDYPSELLAQSIPWGITSVGGSVNATAATGVAWIVDTGIDLDHPDLNVNRTLSKTFVTSLLDRFSADDLNGHGSHVAGIIGAKNNTVGVVGVCAGATLVAVKVLNFNGSGYDSQIIAGLDYVGKNLVAGKVNAVNMSLGGSVTTTLDNAVIALAAKGAKVVLAAGNSSALVSTTSPARVNATNVYTISAYTNTGALASFSNYGDGVDFSAPGVNIYSCYKNGKYTTMSGTSMAAPHVTGILLATNGVINNNGYITGDLDAYPDLKASR